MADLDAEGTERALVIPNYGVPDPISPSPSTNGDRGRPERQTASGRTVVSPRPEDAQRTAQALSWRANRE